VTGKIGGERWGREAATEQGQLVFHRFWIVETVACWWLRVVEFDFLFSRSVQFAEPPVVKHLEPGRRNLGEGSENNGGTALESKLSPMLASFLIVNQHLPRHSKARHRQFGDVAGKLDPIHDDNVAILIFHRNKRMRLPQQFLLLLQFIPVLVIPQPVLIESAKIPH
jgi:hypothetical protein